VVSIFHSAAPEQSVWIENPVVLAIGTRSHLRQRPVTLLQTLGLGRFLQSCPAPAWGRLAETEQSVGLLKIGAPIDIHRRV
jgi:hypothetical protein